MKKTITLICLLLWAVCSFAQIIPVESMVGSRYVHYQHAVSRPFSQSSRLGWAHVASTLVRYGTDMKNRDTPGKRQPNELMSQFYLTTPLSRFLTFQLGAFYTNATEFKGSAALQFAMLRQDWLFIIKPRVNISDLSGFEGFGAVEYRPSLNQEVKLYARLQAMSSYGRSAHQRSYQQVRVGLDTRGVQYGVAVTLDEYGPMPAVQPNIGLFVRTELR